MLPSNHCILPHCYCHFAHQLYLQTLTHPFSSHSPNPYDPLGALMHLIQAEQKRLSTPMTSGCESPTLGDQTDKKNKGKIRRVIQPVQQQNLDDPQSTQKKIRAYRVQKEGRNAFSNLFRMFFRRLELILRSQPDLLEKVISKHEIGLTVGEFKKWIVTLKIDYRNYLKMNAILGVFKCPRNPRHSQMMRVLFKDYIDKYAVSSYLTSKKINKKQMASNLKSVRSILREIQNYDSFSLRPKSHSSSQE